MSTIQAIYQSKGDTASEKEFKHTITNPDHNNNQTKATTVNQNMKLLTDALILLQKDINIYLTSKLNITIDEDMMGDDEDIEENEK